MSYDIGYEKYDTHVTSFSTGGGPHGRGPASRLGSLEPGDKTGLRLSPHLAPSTTSRTRLAAARRASAPRGVVPTRADVAGATTSGLCLWR